MIKEIVLITIGNPFLPKTWSGVPYFLLRELLRKGIIVNVIDLEPNKYIKILYNLFILPIISFFVKEGEQSIYRTLFFRFYQYVIFTIKLPKYKSADAIIGLSYNLLIPETSQPVILLSDWPFSYDLFKKKIKQGVFHRFNIRWEKKCLIHATRVISLFPTCANYINDIIGENKAMALGVNVVNNLMDEPDNSIIYSQKVCNRIVFVGRIHYLQGAMALLSSYHELKKIFPNLQIDIIGLTKGDFTEDLSYLDDGVRFWGYLDKGNAEQCQTYYEILCNASLYVNTTPGWVGYTSMIEAMYYYTPIVVYPCSEFLDEFGSEIDFGAYCRTKDKLVEVIRTILSNTDAFPQLCQNAHKRVAEYTWSNFADKLLSSID